MFFVFILMVLMFCLRRNVEDLRGVNEFFVCFFVIGRIDGLFEVFKLLVIDFFFVCLVELLFFVIFFFVLRLRFLYYIS